MTEAYPTLPDWVQATQLVGAGAINELIACLTPAKRLDDRGSVFYMHDFEHGWGMLTPGGNGTGKAYEISSTLSQSGGLSAKLTSGSSSLLDAYLMLDLPPLPSFQLGFQVSFIRMDYRAGLYVNIDYYVDSVWYWARAGWNYDNKQILYLDEDGIEQVAAEGVGFCPRNFGFIPMKLVADFETGKYMRFLIGKWDIDLSSYNLYHEEALPEMSIQAWFEEVGLSGTNMVCYVDDLILTVDEPA